MVEERVAVYTSLYGGYDALPSPVAQDIEVDWFCFTDDPTLRTPAWRVIIEAPRFAHPRMSAKFHKMRPWDVLPEHRWAIWVDANVLVDNPAFAREAVEIAARGDAGVTTFRHPQRDCILDEAMACASLPKCEGIPVVEQVRSYLAEGYPRHGGLYGCRSIVWDTHDRRARRLGAAWLEECQRWTYRDQLSFPVVARRLGIQPAVFRHHLFRHTVREGVGCWLGRRAWVRSLAGRTHGSTPSPGTAREESHPVPRRWPVIGNPWFDVVPHRLDT